jgi:hypothetical protein
MTNHILNQNKEPKKLNEFQERQNEFRERNKLGRWLHKSSNNGQSGLTYKREHLPTEIKGKKALRFAKRQKVAAMKATQI